MRIRHSQIFALLPLLAVLAAATAFGEIQPPNAAADPVGGQIERKPGAEARGLDTIISVNVDNMDLAEAVRQLASQAGINITLGKDVNGKVSCCLSNVAARTALEAFLRANGYEASPSDGVLVVVKEGSKTSQNGPTTGRRIRKTFHVPYTGKESDSISSTGVSEFSSSNGGGSGGGGGSSAPTGQPSEQTPVQETIKQMLSPDGKLAWYDRQHLMVVEDYEDVVMAIDEFVKEMWKTPPQVFIESKLLEVTLTDGEDLGLRWNTFTKVSGNGKRDQSTGAITANGTGLTSSAPSLGLDRFFSFGIVNANLDIVLEAMETHSRVNLVSNPRVLVMNHRTASVVVGQEIPYLSSIDTTTSSPIRTYAFKEVAVRLDVTPHIADDGKILMDVHPTVKSVIGYTKDPPQPILSVREAATNVAVNSGDTLIIGGLIQRNTTDSVSETPFIAKIPLVGLLFRQKSKSDTKNDLLFLLSPRLLEPNTMNELKQDARGIFQPPAETGNSYTRF